MVRRRRSYSPNLLARDIPLGVPRHGGCHACCLFGVEYGHVALGAVFWLGDEWRWLMDFLLQLFLFCLLGKFILVPAYFWATTFRSAQTLSLSLSLQ